MLSRNIYRNTQQNKVRGGSELEKEVFKESMKLDWNFQFKESMKLDWNFQMDRKGVSTDLGVIIIMIFLVQHIAEKYLWKLDQKQYNLIILKIFFL